MKVELTTELENELYKVQVNELELDGRYLFIRGIVLDIDTKEAFEFEDCSDLSDFCWDNNLEESDNTSGNTSGNTSDEDPKNKGDIK